MNHRTAPASAALALLPWALHALAREVDRAVGLLLHTTLDLPAFVPLALGLVDWPAAARAALAWAAAGALAWTVAGALRRRRARHAGHPEPDWAGALAASASLFAPLLLRPALTLLALAALAWRPAYPYGFTLPVALTQDWGFAQDAAAGAALVAAWLAHAGWLEARRATAHVAPRRGADWRPRAGDVFLLAFLAYGLLAPASSRRWDAHPGNEPKYLRMALALGHGLTLDVGSVTAPMEDLPVMPWRASLPRAAQRVLREGRDLAAAVVRGGALRGPSPDETAGVAHLTVRGRDGGAYHVLAPGPSALLAPALRLDRALNRRLGTHGRLGLTLLFWNALAAALVTAVYLLAHDATRRAGLAALAAAAAAAVPPLVFYSFQFYPEVPAALVFALAVRALLFGRTWSPAACALLGALLAALPWLHQKYLLLWLALAVWSLLRAVDALVPLRALLALLLPQAASLALFALYNFAVTGSGRPDALFRALGREGVSAAHAGQGALGLLLDARYGILPYVPLALVALAGLFLPGADARRVRRALPAAAAYYLTVAAAENWTGSISNLGRFVLPLVPPAAAFAALAVRGAWRRPAALALVLALGAWTARLTLLLWDDPHAANDGGVLLSASALADGRVYLPDLLLRRWSDAAPALGAQLGAWALFAAAAALALRRGVAANARGATRGAGPRGAARGLAWLAALALGVAWGLERFPARRGGPGFGNALRLDADTVLFVSGDARAAGPAFTTRGGGVDLLVRSARRVDALTLGLDRAARLGLRGGATLALPAGARLRLPLPPALRLRGRRGHEEFLARQTLRVAPAPGSGQAEPLRLVPALR